MRARLFYQKEITLKVIHPLFIMKIVVINLGIYSNVRTQAVSPRSFAVDFPCSSYLICNCMLELGKFGMIQLLIYWFEIVLKFHTLFPYLCFVGSVSVRLRIGLCIVVVFLEAGYIHSGSQICNICVSSQFLTRWLAQNLLVVYVNQFWLKMLIDEDLCFFLLGSGPCE